MGHGWPIGEPEGWGVRAAMPGWSRGPPGTAVPPGERSSSRPVHSHASLCACKCEQYHAAACKDLSAHGRVQGYPCKAHRVTAGCSSAAVTYINALSSLGSPELRTDTALMVQPPKTLDCNRSSSPNPRAVQSPPSVTPKCILRHTVDLAPQSPALRMPCMLTSTSVCSSTQ